MKISKQRVLAIALASITLAVTHIVCGTSSAEAALQMHWDFDNVAGSTVTNTGALGASANGTLQAGVSVYNDATFGDVAEYANATNAFTFMGLSGVGISVGDVTTVAGFYKGGDFDYWMDRRPTPGARALIFNSAGIISIHDGTTRSTGYAASNLENHQWHHVAVTINGSGAAVGGLAAGAAELFVDGVSVGTASSLNAWDIASGQTTIWGARNNGTQNNSSGLHHDVRIYDEVLSDAAIAALASGLPATPDAIKVDINGQAGAGGTPGPTAAGGWIGWDPANPNNSALDTAGGSQSGEFAATFATDNGVDIRITAGSDAYERDYGTDAVSGAFSAETPVELWRDQYLINQEAGSPLTITLDDLQAGEYDFTIYSYLDNISNELATTDVFINGVDSGIDLTTYGNAAPDHTAAFLEENAATTIRFEVLNDNDTVTLELRNPTERHVGLNGFQLVAVATATAPEPSTLMLALMGVVGFAVRRRRKR